MAKLRLLVIEDEKEIVRLLQFNLEKEGYEILSASDGAAGLAMAQKDHPDLILLDLMLPKMDGLEVCRAVRKESSVPIIMLTARKEEIDRIIGLEIGADDYVSKPFSVRELAARIKAILRRTQKAHPAPRVARHGMLEIDLDRYIVTVQGKRVPLSSREFELLRILMQAEGRALSRDQLLEKLWGIDQAYDIDTRTVDQHVARLRDKLGSESKRVVTVKNVGLPAGDGIMPGHGRSRHAEFTVLLWRFAYASRTIFKGKRHGSTPDRRSRRREPPPADDRSGRTPGWPLFRADSAIRGGPTGLPHRNQTQTSAPGAGIVPRFTGPFGQGLFLPPRQTAFTV